MPQLEGTQRCVCNRSSTRPGSRPCPRAPASRTRVLPQLGVARESHAAVRRTDGSSRAARHHSVARNSCLVAREEPGTTESACNVSLDARRTSSARKFAVLLDLPTIARHWRTDSAARDWRPRAAVRSRRQRRPWRQPLAVESAVERSGRPAMTTGSTSGSQTRSVSETRPIQTVTWPGSGNSADLDGRRRRRDRGLA